MKQVARKSWAFLLAFVVALTTLFAGTLAVFAEGESNAIDYAGDAVNFIKEDGDQFGMLRADEGTTAVLYGDEVQIHYVLANTNGTYQGFHFGTIDEIPKDENADVASLIDVKVVDDTTMDFTVSADLCGKAVPIAVVKNEYKAGKNGGEKSWTSAEQYYLAIPAADKLEEIPVELAVTNNCGSMFLPEAVSISGREGNYVLHLTMGSDNLTKVFVGYAKDAEENADKAIPIKLTDETEKGKGYVDVPVASVAQPIILAFYGRSWRNRQLTIDLEAKTATYDNPVLPIDEIKNMTTEEALKKAEELATVDLVNALIEAIQVQYRDENTDKYCAVAKAYYDALSDAEKEELDDPGYFGDDTGDASKDDPRNQDNIGAKELLVVSFGTSFNGSRVATIKAVEDTLAEMFPDYAVRRAFTAQIIINHIQSRDGEVIDNMQQALDRAVANGVKELVVQPTHLMHGAEYDEMCAILEGYMDKFESVIISEPLLSTEADRELVATAVSNAAAEAAGFGSLEEMAAKKTALVLMGHGTSHEANVTYTEMQETMQKLGYKNVFVGTVEGEPEGTDAVSMVEKVKAAGYTNVILRPLMVVAGDHANNDMADMDDPESWASIFSAAFGAENVTCQINGLGEIEAVQALYASHTYDAINPEPRPQPVPVGITYAFESLAEKDLTWTMGSGADFNFTVHRSADDADTIKHFTGITIDDKALDPSGYAVVSGSLKGSIKAATMQTLSEGRHTLKVNFDDGSAAATITVVKQAAADPGKKTGDENNMTLWIVLLAAALVGGAASIVVLKGKKESR